jgi:chromosome partitioning protein
VQDEVRRHFPALALSTVIPRSVRLSEAPSHGQSLLRYDPTSRGAEAYASLAEELVRRGYGLPTGGRA